METDDGEPARGHGGQRRDAAPKALRTIHHDQRYRAVGQEAERPLEVLLVEPCSLRNSTADLTPLEALAAPRESGRGSRPSGRTTSGTAAAPSPAGRSRAPAPAPPGRVARPRRGARPADRGRICGAWPRGPPAGRLADPSVAASSRSAGLSSAHEPWHRRRSPAASDRPTRRRPGPTEARSKSRPPRR